MDESTTAPRAGPGRLIDVMAGLAAGSAYVLVVEYIGHEGGLWYWLGPGALGLLLGPLLSQRKLRLPMAAFYVSGIVLMGVFGHLNLLPFAMAFFAVPTALFGISAMATQALARKLARRP